ncbi:MAG: DUF1844 domain-containing protein [Deltaproteobacteria bacterium]|nr:MAG: DUF1844 domain-containing protein [Deltaproteobacteria bacterium]
MKTGASEEEKVEAESGVKKETSEQKPPPLPEMNFSNFILSLSTSVLIHLGEIPDPLSNQKQKNLPFAKQTIDILEILKDKTKGNLEKEEERLLDNLLYDLRMKYVQEAKS